MCVCMQPAAEKTFWTVLKSPRSICTVCLGNLVIVSCLNRRVREDSRFHNGRKAEDEPGYHRLLLFSSFVKSKEFISVHALFVSRLLICVRVYVVTDKELVIEGKH